MIKAGVIDPAKVTRLALQNAASIAGLMLTTEALVADIKEDDKQAAAGAGGHGGPRRRHGRNVLNRRNQVLQGKRASRLSRDALFWIYESIPCVKEGKASNARFNFVE